MLELNYFHKAAGKLVEKNLEAAEFYLTEFEKECGYSLPIALVKNLILDDLQRIGSTEEKAFYLLNFPKTTTKFSIAREVSYDGSAINYFNVTTLNITDESMEIVAEFTYNRKIHPFPIRLESPVRIILSNLKNWRFRY